MNTSTERQRMGCGYELPLEGARGWAPPSSGVGFTGFGEGLDYYPTTCPGYTTSLPEVIEVARARSWRDDLRTFTGGDAPTEHLIDAIDMLDAECQRYERWALMPQDEGGGRRSKS